MTKMRKAYIILGAAVISGFVCNGCGILPTEEEFGVAPVVKEYEGSNYNKYTVVRDDMVQKESISVTYQGTREVEITGSEGGQSEGGGRIKKVCVQKGQKVKVGTVLVQEYSEDAEEQLLTDKRQIASLQLQIKQAKEMKKRELEQLTRTGGSKEEKENVRTQFDSQIKNCQSNIQLTQLDMKEAQETIAEAVITSEVEGVVTEADHSFDGGYAGSDNVLVKVQGKKKNRFVCKTKYAGHFHDGQEVSVTIGGGQYGASVKKVSAGELYLYPKKTSSLKHGAVGTVDLILKEKKNVLSLPLALVYDMGGKKVVYMEGKNGIKETREVTLGETINNMVEITSGLQENEQVITN